MKWTSFTIICATVACFVFKYKEDALQMHFKTAVKKIEASKEIKAQNATETAAQNKRLTTAKIGQTWFNVVFRNIYFIVGMIVASVVVAGVAIPNLSQLKNTNSTRVGRTKETPKLGVGFRASFCPALPKGAKNKWFPYS